MAMMKSDIETGNSETAVLSRSSSARKKMFSPRGHSEYLLVEGTVRTSHSVENLLSLMMDECSKGVWYQDLFICSYKDGVYLALKVVGEPRLSILVNKSVQRRPNITEISLEYYLNSIIDIYNDLKRFLDINGFQFYPSRSVLSKLNRADYPPIRLETGQHKAVGTSPNSQERFARRG